MVAHMLTSAIERILENGEPVEGFAGVDYIEPVEVEVSHVGLILAVGQGSGAIRIGVQCHDEPRRWVITMTPEGVPGVASATVTAQDGRITFEETK